MKICRTSSTASIASIKRAHGSREPALVFPLAAGSRKRMADRSASKAGRERDRPSRWCCPQRLHHQGTATRRKPQWRRNRRIEIETVGTTRKHSATKPRRSGTNPSIFCLSLYYHALNSCFFAQIWVTARIPAAKSELPCPQFFCWREKAEISRPWVLDTTRNQRFE